MNATIPLAIALGAGLFAGYVAFGDRSPRQLAEAQLWADACRRNVECQAAIRQQVRAAYPPKVKPQAAAGSGRGAYYGIDLGPLLAPVHPKP